MAERIFAKLCELRQVITNAADERHELEWAVERQLETLLRALPATISVTALSKCFSKPVDGVELDVITRVFSSVARSGPDLRAELDDNLRERFRAYMKNAVAFSIQQDDFWGELKANVGSVLASVGAPEDMGAMCELVRADIERVRKGQAARARNDRGKQGNGASTSYASWHIRSVVRLEPVNWDSVLIDLLNAQEYEPAVATELFFLIAAPTPREGFIRKVDYDRVWQARGGVREEPHKDHRKRFAAAIRNRMEALSKERAGAEQRVIVKCCGSAGHDQAAFLG